MNDAIYQPAFVRGLFNEMAGTYGLMNLVTSFGFALLWRRHCVRGIAIAPGSTVADLMSGTGELSSPLSQIIGETGTVRGIDFSAEMCNRARRKSQRFPMKIEIIECDAMATPLADESVDCVASSFGLKTLSPEDYPRLAAEVRRILKPGGAFAFLEISVPPHAGLRMPYMFYLKRIIPFVGWLFLGNPENYRLLGVYTEAFQNVRLAASAFAADGLEVESTSYFFGCATGFRGRKPS